jgi:hypothetical protein
MKPVMCNGPNNCLKGRYFLNIQIPSSDIQRIFKHQISRATGGFSLLKIGASLVLERLELGAFYFPSGSRAVNNFC